MFWSSTLQHSDVQVRLTVTHFQPNRFQAKIGDYVCSHASELLGTHKQSFSGSDRLVLSSDLFWLSTVGLLSFCYRSPHLVGEGPLSAPFSRSPFSPHPSHLVLALCCTPDLVRRVERKERSKEMHGNNSSIRYS